MRRPRAAVVAAVASVVASLIAPAAPAGALVATTTQLTAPFIVGVGQAGVAAKLAISNQNSESANNLVWEIRLALGCTGPPGAGTLCPGAGPGSFAAGPAAVGQSSLQFHCNGHVWPISPPDADGTVRVLLPTHDSDISLHPGGVCFVHFTFSVLATPPDAAPSTPGVQTFINAAVRAESAGRVMSSAASHPLTVRPGTPTITIQPSPTVETGGLISARATVTGAPGLPAPTGTVDFLLSEPTCVFPAGLASTGRPIVGGVAQSAETVAHTGTYRWVVRYNGDTNYPPVTTPCATEGNTVIVFPRRALFDFNGDGATDIALFRPSTATWLIRSGSGDTIRDFGIPGDVPVAGDYDGDRKAELAVFRPATGTWFIEQSSGGTVTGAFGINGDLPVPADYDGDGRTDIAVFRPSTGVWFIAHSGGGTVVGAFGVPGDVPVPEDYDGDGRADLALFRPASGHWFVAYSSGGMVAGVHGMEGDIPVPADYDGDRRADIGVFRRTNGYWFISPSGGGSIVGPFGDTTDVPVPGDYEGDEKADLAVYRSVPRGPLPNRPCICQAFFIQESSTQHGFGITGDRPVGLPPAIRAMVYPPP